MKSGWLALVASLLMNSLSAGDARVNTMKLHATPTSEKNSDRPVKKKCVLTERCSNGNTAKHWFRDATAAGLMHEKMAALGIPESTFSRVAIVDSGIDGSLPGEFETLSPIRMRRGATLDQPHPIEGNSGKIRSSIKKEKIGDPTTDNHGHGTHVASIIAGKEMGLANSVHLSTYRATGHSAAGYTERPILDMALWRACRENRDPEGITLINLSWGSRLDETGFNPDEKNEIRSRLLEMLAKEGCLVVKSAGNSSFRSSQKANLDDAYLRVAAINQGHDLSPFSSLGEVQAPGSDMYGIQSSQALVKFRVGQRDVYVDKLCEQRNPSRSVLNGTSFSAPVTTAIASQINRALKHFDLFKGLQGPKRISLVNRILKASMQIGTINGLRAMKIIEEMARIGIEKRSFAFGRNFISWMNGLIDRNPDPVCMKIQTPCAQEVECKKIQSCFKVRREQLALCPDVPLSTAIDMMDTAFKHDAHEHGIRFARMAQQRAQNNKEKLIVQELTVQKYLNAHEFYDSKNSWEKFNYGIIGKLDVNFTKAFLAPYLDTISRGTDARAKSEVIRQIASSLLFSSQIERALQPGIDPVTGEDRGSNSVLDTVDSVLSSARRAGGNAGFAKLINEFIVDHLQELDELYRDEGKSSVRTKASTAEARILSRLIDNEQNPKWQKYLLDLESQMLLKMRKVNQHYGHETQQLYAGSEDYPSRSSFNGMLNRNLNDTLKTWQEKGLKALAPLEVHRIFSVPDKYGLHDEQAKNQFYLEILKTMGANQGWDAKGNRELTIRSLANLWKAHDRSLPMEANRIKNGFKRIIEKSSNLELLAMILDSYWENQVIEVDRYLWFYDRDREEALTEKGWTYQNHPLFTRELIRSASLKMIAATHKLKKTDAPDFTLRPDVRSGFELALRSLIYHSKVQKNSGKIIVPTMSKHRLSRRFPAGPVETVDRNTATFQTYLEGIIRLATISAKTELGGHANKILAESLKLTSSVEAPLKSNLNEFLKDLPQNGAWRDILEKHAANVSGSGSADAKIAIRNFLSQVDLQHYKKNEVK